MIILQDQDRIFSLSAACVCLLIDPALIPGGIIKQRGEKKNKKFLKNRKWVTRALYFQPLICMEYYDRWKKKYI